MTRKVALTDDRIEAVTLPSSKDKALLEFSLYNRIYLTQEKGNPICIYKLHKQNSREITDDRYIWIAMWNSCAWTMYPGADKNRKDYYTSIEEAVRCALLNGNKVRQLNISDLPVLEWVFSENV